MRSKSKKSVILFNLALFFASFCILFTSFSGSAKAVPLSTEKSSDVIVVGAGLSGLTTAYKLMQAGFSCKVLELTHRTGGRTRTAKYDNAVHVEAGLAEFWDSNPAMDLIRELKIPYVESFTYSSVRLDNKIYPLTQNSNEEFHNFLFNDNERKAFKKWDSKMGGYLKQIKVKKFDDFLWSLKKISFADFVKSAKLPRKVSEWIRVTIEVEIGTQWDEISALDGVAEWHIFTGKGETAHELENGNETLIDALAEKVGMKNIGLDMQVVKFKNVKDGVEVEAIDTATSKSYTYKAKYAVSTIPLFAITDVQFDPPLSSERKSGILSQTWGHYFTAHVFFDPSAEHYWTKDGKNILPILSDSPLGVIYSATQAKKGDPFIVNLLVTGQNAEKFNYRAGFMDSAKNELSIAFEKIWKGSSKLIKKCEFYRYHPSAIASWPVGRSRFDKISDGVRKPHGRVYFAGDYTESSHSDGSVISALRVVNDIKALEKKK